MRRRRKNTILTGLYAAASTIALTAAMSVAVAAEPEPEPAPGWLQIDADEARFDPETGTYTAEGDVVITYEGRTVKAARVVYDRETGEVTATGGVTLRDPGGTVIYAESVRLTDDLEEGFIEGVQALLSDGSHLAATEGRREGGNRNALSYAVYSPCEICEGEEPLWQIKARRVVHDQEDRTLRYRDAFLEVKGVPVFYLPWFSHPDPSVDRRTGLLPPDFSTDSQLGVGIKVPFYWSPNDHRDFTIAPKWTSSEGTILFGEYREHVGYGTHQLEGSITHPIERDENNEPTGDRILRGHIFGTARYGLDRHWRSGFDVAWASDDTYLKRYDITRADRLKNNLFVDRLDAQSYFAVNAYSFQGLRQEDIQDQIPVILPLTEYHYRSRPGWRGSTWSADGNVLALHRVDGADMYRMSVSGEWTLPYTTPNGQKLRLTLRNRGDLYVNHDTDRVDATWVESRIAPMAAVEWRWPFVRHDGSARHVVEPVVNLVGAPEDKNPADIPNEDSLDVEFSDLNLFRLNRSPGLDVWEDGTRANYGLRYKLLTAGGVQGSVLVGQSWRFTGESPFPARTGLDDDRSDIVTGVTLNIPGFFDLHHSMRLDEGDLSIERNQVELYAGPPSYRLRLGYLDAGPQGFDPNLPKREEVDIAAHIRISESWSTNARLVRSFDNDVGTIRWAFGVTYEGTCLRLQTTLERNNLRDRDIQPTTSVFFRISLLHLG